MFYWLIKLLFWPVAKFYFRMSIRGNENIPGDGPALIAANHTSFLDPPCLGSASPRKVHFMIKKRMYEKFMQNWFYRWMETIPVRESQADLDAIRTAINSIKKGEIVGIFPQGRRISPEDREPSWLNGVSFIAAKTGCPTIPCAIIGTEKALGIDACFPKPIKIQVVFGRPLRFPDRDGEKVRKEEIMSFTHMVFREMEGLRKNRNGELQGAKNES